MKPDARLLLSQKCRFLYITRCKIGVQQGDLPGPLLFSLVLIDFLSSVSFPAGLAFQLWYSDDGTLVGTRSSLAPFAKVRARYRV